MKKILVATLLAISTVAMAADPKDSTYWQIPTTVNHQGAEVPAIYSVLPKTVRMYKTPSGALQWDALIEMTIMKTPPVIVRERFAATGCKEATGKAGWIEDDGALQAGTTLYLWDADGERVYDHLATKICVSFILKVEQENKKGPSVIKPTKKSVEI